MREARISSNGDAGFLLNKKVPSALRRGLS
ncbi:MAG: hypothetical protein RL318_1638, partial [Fibrobacterota bacterium]